MQDDRPEMADSPLLNSEAEGSPHSTIHPDRLDISRFSDMNEEEQSSLRIIIYVVVVIVLGIGAALAVRQFLFSDNGDETPTEETAEAEDTNESVKISTEALPDNSADKPSDIANYKTAEQSTLGDASLDASTSEVTVFEYQRYETFGRTRFEVTGLEDATVLPGPISVQFNNTANTLKVTFPEGLVVNEDLQEEISIQDIVNTVTYAASDNSFTMQLREESLYNIQTFDDALVIDIKTQTQYDTDLNGPAEEEETPTETEEPVVEEEPAEETPTETPTNTGETNFTNEFSQNTQSINSNVTGNTLNLTEAYYEDAGPYFEVAWGEEGKNGDSTAPNATAELKDDNGTPYIEVKVQNLNSVTVPTVGNTSNINGIDFSNANFVSSELTSFTDGTATFKITLKYKSNFKLISVPTIDGATRVTAVQIQD